MLETRMEKVERLKKSVVAGKYLENVKFSNKGSKKLVGDIFSHLWG